MVCCALVTKHTPCAGADTKNTENYTDMMVKLAHAGFSCAAMRYHQTIAAAKPTTATTIIKTKPKPSAVVACCCVGVGVAVDAHPTIRNRNIAKLTQNIPHGSYGLDSVVSLSPGQLKVSADLCADCACKNPRQETLTDPRRANCACVNQQFAMTIVLAINH